MEAWVSKSSEFFPISIQDISLPLFLTSLSHIFFGLSFPNISRFTGRAMWIVATTWIVVGLPLRWALEGEMLVLLPIKTQIQPQLQMVTEYAARKSMFLCGRINEICCASLDREGFWICYHIIEWEDTT